MIILGIILLRIGLLTKIAIVRTPLTYCAPAAHRLRASRVWVAPPRAVRGGPQREGRRLR